MSLAFTSPPKSICVLRLSAVGDICHALPVIRTIQSHWPDSKITWVIGKIEHSLIGDIDDIEFIVFDKSQGVWAYKNFYSKIKHRRFDVLLHMQMSLRSSVINRLIRSPCRIGFDRARAKDIQWLFNNAQIPAHQRQHVMDSFFGFSEALGINTKNLDWSIPLSAEDRQNAGNLLPPNQDYIVISPCSSMSYRNWHAAGYAEVANYAYDKHSLRSIICGGPSDIEKTLSQEITQLTHLQAINLVGKTTLKELLAILDQAVTLITPDSGPAHMATCVNTPVIGLYACTNPDRARPYLSADFVVNKYPPAIKQKYGKNIDELEWGVRVRDSWAMNMIKPSDIIEQLEKIIQKIDRSKKPATTNIKL